MKSALLFCVFLNLACSTTHLITPSPQDDEMSFDEFNAGLDQKEATIVFTNDTSVAALGVSITPDSLFWSDATTSTRKSGSIKSIKSVVVVEQGEGAVEGMYLGLLSGVVVGLVTAAVAVGEPHDLEGLAYIILPAVGGGAGLVAGLIVGIVNGHPYTYQFQSSETPKPETRILIERSPGSSDILHLKNGSTLLGTITEIIFEKYGTGTIIRYVKNGAIHRRVIVGEIEKGNRLKTVVIEVEGVHRTIDAGEITRIEKTE